MNRKAAGKKIEAPAPAEERGKVIDLMEALRRSVQGERGRKASARQKGKKRTARRHQMAA